MEVDQEEEAGEEEDEEVGWKLVHGDVFRFPRAVDAPLGGGGQRSADAGARRSASSCSPWLGTFYPGNRGALYSAAVVLYCGHRLHRRLRGHPAVPADGRHANGRPTPC